MTDQTPDSDDEDEDTNGASSNRDSEEIDPVEQKKRDEEGEIELPDDETNSGLDAPKNGEEDDGEDK